MINQIISGAIVAIVSFFFGYLLFVVQRKEAIRLELMKKRLNSYDKIMAFMQKIDQEIISKDYILNKSEKDRFVLEIYHLTLPNMIYLSKEIYRMLELHLVDLIDALPESGDDLMNYCDEIKTSILDEVGANIITSKHIKKILGNKKKINPKIYPGNFFD